MRTILVFLIIVTMAGCTTTSFLDEPMGVSAPIVPVVAKFKLAHYLRSEGYLVSETTEGLQVDTPVYKSKAKGIFGWGPVWEEKVVYHITFEEASVVVPVVRSGNESHSTSSGTVVYVQAMPYERQNENFDWIEKEGAAFNEDVIHDFYKKIENQLRA